MRNGFVTATLVHLIFVGALLFFAFWEPRREPEPMVFEIVQPPSSVAPRPDPAPEPEPLAVAVEIEEIPTPEPPPRPPRPEPPPPDPTPPPPEPTPPAPEPEPEPEPERVDFSQFQKTNPIRQRQPEPRREEPRREVTAPRIDTREITQSLRNTNLDQATLDRLESQSSADQDRMAAYFERLRSEVRGAWQPPPGLPSHLEVRVQFSLGADGRISNARVVSSSGNAGFDDSVLEAFRRLGSTAPPPDRQAYAPSLRFGVD